MTSLIAWLDASSEDQRRMREIVNLFSERESRDELGIGQVRDALSDSLWPGTSTLFTRARYFLFIPWCFRAAAEARNDIDQGDRARRPERTATHPCAHRRRRERRRAGRERWSGAQELAVGLVLGRDAHSRDPQGPHPEQG